MLFSNVMFVFCYVCFTLFLLDASPLSDQSNVLISQPRRFTSFLLPLELLISQCWMSEWASNALSTSSDGWDELIKGNSNYICCKDASRCYVFPRDSVIPELRYPLKDLKPWLLIQFKKKNLLKKSNYNWENFLFLLFWNIS